MVQHEKLISLRWRAFSADEEVALVCRMHAAVRTRSPRLEAACATLDPPSEHGSGARLAGGGRRGRPAGRRSLHYDPTRAYPGREFGGKPEEQE